MAKRRPGKRERNGRLQRDPKAETEWLAMEPVLRRRCRHLGWRVTVDNMRKVRGQEGGTPWGMVYLAGDITRAQYEAAERFASLRASWLESIAAPGCKGSCMEPGQRGASLVAENVRLVRAVRAEYMAAERALRGAGTLPTHAVFALLFEGTRPNLDMLRTGLNNLAKHLDVAARPA